MKINPNDNSLSERITYLNTTIEDHIVQTDDKYDAVVISEVLEHVDDKEAFLKACTTPLAKGGSIFITTFNKTNFAWLGGIICAEYILNMIPRGTHDYNKFITPLDTQRLLEQGMSSILLLEHLLYYILLIDGCSTILCNGFLFEFWRKKWVWTKHQQFSYALQAVKL